MNTKILKWFGIGAVILFILLCIWYFFFNKPTTTTTSGGATTTTNTTITTGTGAFGAPAQTIVTIPVGTTGGGTTNVSQPVTQAGMSQGPTQKIFKIADGPVAGAIYIQTQNPTTTVARYIMQDTGHVLDFPVDVPGAVARSVSNTTIPGIQQILWTGQGTGAILNHLDGQIIRTISIGLTSATSTITAGTPLIAHVTFLHDSMISAAISPDGKNIAYLLGTANGSDGYTANIDGTNAKKIFSLPLSQVTVSWPTQTALMVQTKTGVGIPGIAFSIPIKTGVPAQLFYAPGLSAVANSTFTRVVYQTIDDGATAGKTYSHDVVNGRDIALSHSPLPEKCTWSPNTATILYCAASITAMPANYIDLWHMGLLSAIDGIFAFNLAIGQATALAVPGSVDGGVQTDVASLAVSPNEKYILFISKKDRSLWGVRL